MEKKISEKKSHNAEKLKGTLWGFSTSILSQNIKKLKGENFYFREKNPAVPKKKLKEGRKGEPFGLARYGGQRGEFDTIIFCRTFKNYFGHFVCIEKSHYNSRGVSLQQAPTKN